MAELTALRINVAGTRAEEMLSTALKQVALSDICYAYKSRVKRDADLIEKVNRKKMRNPDIRWSQ